MKMSVREARAQFAMALAAVENGESVTITKNGKAVAELNPPKKKGGINWEKLAEVRKEFGWENATVEFDPAFDDPAVSRKLLGLDP
ncbi:MAG: type II toxin-antitoxin system prevent-host-death family antitoxin [Sphingomonas sp.]|uniref:type II toxin-antitoxin system Phd/YefM family antitoxin n=1 Tax=Sphingomonas sp. TaxID=28214 RepID=UPI0011FD20A9|nr:type II toxin-antitoxin system prevent-host-death family antitoxin [Sphingomonas sp.]THD35585.1 MAG: type II toxin-antitoxin system prevent-host-death family antitoxin [Sphingomonas sp.]